MSPLETQSLNTTTSDDEDYVTWKNWGQNNFGILSAKDSQYFSAEIKKTKQSFGPGSSVLEIGFGNGNFLQFAKSSGWNVCGVEINENLVKVANDN